MKYVITYCRKRVLSHRLILEAAMLKVSIDAWNVAEGEQEERGLEGGTGETWTGFKVPRRSEQLEVKSALGGVCVSCDFACMCLYTAAYLLACLKQTCRRTCINITYKNKHLRMQLTVSTSWNEIIPQTKTSKLFSFLKTTGMHFLNAYSNLDNDYGLVIWLRACSMHELWWKLDKCRTFTKAMPKWDGKKIVHRAGSGFAY